MRTAPAFRSAWVLALIVAFVSGCAAPYGKLVREDTVPDLYAAAQATRSHRSSTVVPPTQTAGGPRLGMAVHELETAQADRILVMIHGVFADHETWRFVAGNLARDHGVWLVDLPGCGASDTPDTITDQTFSIPDTAERTLQALRSCMKGRPTPRFALVGHSYGAAVIVRMFSDAGLRDRYADVLERVDRLVLISPLDIAINSPSPLFKQIAEASALKVRLANALGILKGRIAAATIASVPDARRALREEADKRIEIMRDSDKRRSLQRMIAGAVPWTSAFRPDWERIEAVESTYSSVDRECLIIVGMRDEALPAAMSYKMAVQLPRAWLVPLKGIMHSPHIEAHDRCATLIREFVTTGRVDSDVLRSLHRAPG